MYKMETRRDNIVTLATFCIFILSCVVDESEPETAGENTYSPDSLDKDSAREKHCVIDTNAVPNDRADDFEVERASALVVNCFSELARAIEFATNGRVQLPLDATIDDVDDALRDDEGSHDSDPNGTEATYVIAVEYIHANYGGSTLTYTNSVTCSGYSHSAAYMPSGWNDVISSARAYSSCNHAYHYEHTYYGGAVVDCRTGCSYVGDAMNDRTSSIRWTQ